MLNTNTIYDNDWSQDETIVQNLCLCEHSSKTFSGNLNLIFETLLERINYFRRQNYVSALIFDDQLMRDANQWAIQTAISRQIR